MPKKPIQLGNLFFEKQEDAKSYIIQILDNNINKFLDGEELDVVFDLLKRHPEYEKKVGCGIEGIYVAQAQSTYGENIKPSRCFHIKRLDGSKEHFSYKKCLRGGSVENLIKSRRNNAYRTAIDEQVMTFKLQNQHSGCEQCGCSTDDKCHVDHVTPFYLLVREFEKQFPELPTQFDEHPTYYKKKFRAEDKDFAERWQEFHKQNAKLRILCASCNFGRERKTEKGD